MEDNTILKLKIKSKEVTLKRLAFLGDFLMMVNFKGVKELGKILGASYQSVKLNLEKDNMQLSQIIQIVEYYGYKISFRLGKTNEDHIIMKKTDNGIQLLNNNDDVCYRIESHNMDKKLSFLTYAMKKYNIIVWDIVTEGIAHSSTVAQRFEKDDCPFSYITNIAKAFDLKLYINIQPNNTTETKDQPQNTIQ